MCPGVSDKLASALVIPSGAQVSSITQGHTRMQTYSAALQTVWMRYNDAGFGTRLRFGGLLSSLCRLILDGWMAERRKSLPHLYLAHFQNPSLMADCGFATRVLSFTGEV